MKNHPNCRRRLKVDTALFFCTILGVYLLSGVALPSEKEKGYPPSFLPEEQKIILEFFHSHASGLPPGLAKRGGNLPPGLQRHLQRNGMLPPGLQKRLQPFPVELEQRLPRIPEIWRRVILGRHVILLDRRTSRILDIIENVVGLITDQ